jgi:histidinol-phosphatase (PHP family)
MLYRTDYHIHSTFSDGKAHPEDYIAAAKYAGLKEMGFSEHLNLFRESQEWCMPVTILPEYLNYIKSLARHEKEIIIRTGLEVDFFPGKSKEIYEFLRPLKLDYIIGSVHYMGEVSVDSSADFYNGKDTDRLYEDYFELLFEAVESGIFDILAHADLIRIYGHQPAGNPGHLYRKLARKMKMHEVAIELNTNGRNRPLGDFYPDRRYLDIFNDEGVSICVNSDSHLPIRVGQYFDEAYFLLKESGFNEMAVFRKRERLNIPADFSGF